MALDAASYRDPSGHVHIVGPRVFRTVTPEWQSDYRAVKESRALDSLIERGLVIGATEVDPSLLPDAAPGDLVLEHPRIPVVSYPYEWPFAGLKAAALLHLDIQLELLDHDIALVDASAFNIQFLDAHPIFIDYLSFRRYRDGEPWLAHQQFCKQFLNPLILYAKLGVPFHAWYRGHLEGIESGDLADLLKLHHKLSPVMFSHVVLLGRLQGRADESTVAAARAASRRGLSRTRFRAMLLQLRSFIAGLAPARTKQSRWGGYAETNTYESEERGDKRSFVERFVAEVRPDLLIDLGCNTGDFSQVALSAGARHTVGFDSDPGVLDRAFARAQAEKLKLLPLYQDLANPSPNLGWTSAERRGLGERFADADAVLALAFVHHLAIARNIPLTEAVGAIITLAPAGVIEFVPKGDPTVQTMLALRDDIFSQYDRAAFVDGIEAHATIKSNEVISANGRELFFFQRR